MSSDWQDLQAECAARELPMAIGVPVVRQCDAHVWQDDDIAGFLDAAQQCAARLLYAEPVTIADEIATMRRALDDLRMEFFDESLAEVERLDLALLDIHCDPTTQVGWRAQWRHETVAHIYADVQLPNELDAIDTQLAQLFDLRPTTTEARMLSRLALDDSEAEQKAELQERFDTAAEMLADDPDFPPCGNQASRRNLLKKLDVDTTGLNKDDIIAESKRLSPSSD